MLQHRKVDHEPQWYDDRELEPVPTDNDVLVAVRLVAYSYFSWRSDADDDERQAFLSRANELQRLLDRSGVEAGETLYWPESLTLDTRPAVLREIRRLNENILDIDRHDNPGRKEPASYALWVEQLRTCGGRLEELQRGDLPPEDRASTDARLVSLGDVARLNVRGFSKRTLEKLLKDGTIPPPDVPGQRGRGRPHRWKYNRLRDALASLGLDLDPHKTTLFMTIDGQKLLVKSFVNPHRFDRALNPQSPADPRKRNRVW